MIEKNNNMGSKISVIVPVYNGEECISRCVDSIILQSFTDWELILIDDGSVDASCLICDDYAQKDTRIKVVHKKNGGVVQHVIEGSKKHTENMCYLWMQMIIWRITIYNKYLDVMKI